MSYLPLREAAGQDGQRDAQEAVGAHLEHDAGEQDRRCGGRFDVRVGQPRVQREDRDLHREAQEEREEEPPLQLCRKRRPEHGELDQVEAAGLQVERDHTHEHEHRAEQRVEEELDRRVLPARTAPLGDQEVHGDEHELPEHVEQHEVERDEHAVHAHLQQQQHREVERRLLVDLPACDDREQGEQRREEHERHRDAVDAHVVLDARLRHPGELLDELHRGVRERSARA